MPIDPQITAQSSAIRTSWITAQPPAPVARLQLTGFRANNEGFFSNRSTPTSRRRSGQSARPPLTSATLITRDGLITFSRKPRESPQATRISKRISGVLLVLCST